MKRYISVLIVIIVAFAFIIYLFSQPSSGVEIEKCKYCHGTVKPISQEIITKPCSQCHGMHSTSEQPQERNPEVVHSIHKYAGRYVQQKACQVCHQSPIQCSKCHNTHEDLGLNRGNNISCSDCHGQLPQPKGHEEFRMALSKSSHKWMNCGTCHLNPSNNNDKFEFRFKNLITISMEKDDSIKICRICHSLQYGKMKEGTHGSINNTCINCHNPHTTQMTGPSFEVTPTETPVNISMKFEEGKEWLTEKIPALNNPTIVIIVFMIFLVMIAEYGLSKHEEGTKVSYDMIKFIAGEETLKTLEVKLKNQNVNTINQILQGYGNILGMTMKKEKDKELDIFKYVIFIDVNNPMDEIGEKEIIDNISLLEDVKSVQFSDKYEL